MGVYVRRDSPYYWLILERPGQRPLFESTKIPHAGPTPEARAQAKALAQAIYHHRMLDLARERYDLPRAKPSRTWRQHATWYGDTISPTKRNTARERSMLRQLTRHFGDTPLGRIDRAAVQAWVLARSGEVAPNTVRRELELLRHALGEAVPTYLEVNPATKITTPKPADTDIRLLTIEEEDRLLAAASSAWRALVLTALDTLARLSSVAALTWPRDHGTHLVVLNSKTGTYRVPVSQRLRRALDVLPRTARGPIFPWLYPTPPPRDPEAWRRKQIIDGFAALCEAAEVPYGRAAGGVTFHGLRHTGASRMLAAGVSIKTVQQIGNWASLTVLQRYLHPTEAERRAAVERIGSRLVDGRVA